MIRTVQIFHLFLTSEYMRIYASVLKLLLINDIFSVVRNLTSITIKCMARVNAITTAMADHTI